jgi:arsenite-transporting ATPase
MYDGRDPTDVLYDEPTFEVREEGDAYVIDVRLPFADEEDVDVRHFGDQLVVQVANQRRNYILPNFLSYYALQSSSLRDGWLHVRFEEE